MIGPGRRGRAVAFPRSSWGAGARRGAPGRAFWRPLAHRVWQRKQPREAEDPLPGALAHASHQYTCPCTQKRPPAGGTPPTRKNVPRRGNFPTQKTRLISELVRQVRQKETLQPWEAAKRGALARPRVRRRCASVRPAVRHAAWRRFALPQTLDRTSTSTATNAKHRGKNAPNMFFSGECAQCARAPVWGLSNGREGWCEWLAIRASTSRSRAFARRASAFCSRCARADASPLTPVRTYVVCLYRKDDGRGGPP